MKSFYITFKPACMCLQVYRFVESKHFNSKKESIPASLNVWWQLNSPFLLAQDRRSIFLGTYVECVPKHNDNNNSITISNKMGWQMMSWKKKEK